MALYGLQGEVTNSHTASSWLLELLILEEDSRPIRSPAHIHTKALAGLFLSLHTHTRHPEETAMLNSEPTCRHHIQ